MTVSASKRLKGFARRCGKCASIPKPKKRMRRTKFAQRVLSLQAGRWFDEQSGDVNTDFIVIDPLRLLAVDCFE
jgi:hypothetical protein